MSFLFFHDVIPAFLPPFHPSFRSAPQLAKKSAPQRWIWITVKTSSMRMANLSKMKVALK